MQPHRDIAHKQVEIILLQLVDIQPQVGVIPPHRGLPQSQVEILVTLRD